MSEPNFFADWWFVYLFSMLAVLSLVFLRLLKAVKRGVHGVRDDMD